MSGCGHRRILATAWDLCGAAARIFGGWCCDDGFRYFRRWLVGQGRATFESAVALPDSLAGVPAITRLAGRHRRDWDDEEEWPEWESLDYVAKDAYESVTGIADECGEGFYDAVETRFGSTTFKRDPDGERWSANDEAIVALKIPLPAALFPVG